MQNMSAMTDTDIDTDGHSFWMDHGWNLSSASSQSEKENSPALCVSAQTAAGERDSESVPLSATEAVWQDRKLRGHSPGLWRNIVPFLSGLTGAGTVHGHVLPGE